LPPPKFLYFDLGNVLLCFDVGVMCQQVAAVAGVDPAEVFQAILCTPLQREYELGRVSTREFFEEFCRQTGARPDFEPLLRATSDIFELNMGLIPVVANLRQAGYRLGVLSNTCESHWEHCVRRYAILREFFDAHALSYRIGAAKPDSAIFEAAARLAGVGPQDIFFTDDTPGHVEAARAAGFDAVQYTATAELVGELRRRGVELNY
jgi:FMN phosphatase YigB (HAD superfamily)